MFCRNCGKDIGDSKFCSACGTMSEINEETKETLEEINEVEENDAAEAEIQEAEVESGELEDEGEKVVLGEYGEIITPEGKKIFSSAQSAYEAPRRTATKKITKAESFMAKVMALGLTLTALGVFNWIPNFTFSSWISFSASFLAAAAYVTTVIMGVVIRKCNANWIKENNVDVYQTVERDKSANRGFCTQIAAFHLIGQKPGFFAFPIIIGILSSINGAYFMISFGFFISFLAGTPILIFGFFLIPWIIIFIVNRILEAIYYSKAKKFLAKSAPKQEESNN